MTRSSITLEVGGYCIAISGADLRIAVEPGEQRPVDADRSPLKASCPHEAGGVPRSNNEPTSPPISSEPISSPAETKAADAPPPASAATVRKTAAHYRPHCQHPDACGSSKLAHCRSCAVAAGLVEEAA